MRRLLMLCALSTLVAAAHAAGAVQVTFVKPENFADMRDRAWRVEDNVQKLEKVIVEAATPYVGDGQTLKIEVMDVDLAGETRPGARATDVRVLRGRADWPRITLRWSLERAGSAPRTGEAVVQDMSYLERSPRPMNYNHLVFERRMLDEWFREHFGSGKAS